MEKRGVAMRINWKLRIQNKATCLALLIELVAFVYTLLGIFDIVPLVARTEMEQLIMAGVEILTALGVLVDPTTKGIDDSQKAMEYQQPK